MKVGIRFSDNDFWETMRMFLTLYIVPTFVEREEGHMVTHLTSSMIVDLFNMYAPHLCMYLHEKSAEEYGWKLCEHQNLQHYREYLKITEQNIYWDNNTDDFVADWESGDNNGEFHWTNGKDIY